MTKSRLSSSEITPIALAPVAAQSCTAIEPRPPRGAPDQHIVARPQDVRAVAEQHPPGRGERQRVAGALFPGQVLRPVHELLGLDPGELGEGAVRRLVAPDALGGREHRVAAVAFLVVAVVLVAVDDDLVADLPVADLLADRPDDAAGVGPGDMERRLVDVEGRDRRAERSPDAVIVDARRHHEDQHFAAVQRRRLDDLDLHRAFRLAVALAPDRPGVHLLRHIAERRDLADLVEVLLLAAHQRIGRRRVFSQFNNGRGSAHRSVSFGNRESAQGSRHHGTGRGTGRRRGGSHTLPTAMLQRKKDIKLRKLPRKIIQCFVTGRSKQYMCERGCFAA